MRLKRIATALSLLTVLALGGAAGAGASTPAKSPPIAGGRFSDCFWRYGAFGVHDYNIAYPDAGATYWAAYFRHPAGTTLTLRGSYPHSRYMSVSAYNILGAGVDSLADYQIDPDGGSSNPFRRGALRTAKHRRYTITVEDTVNPLPLEPKDGAAHRNVLYARTNPPNLETIDGDTADLNLLLLRVYVPDRGRDLTGGVGLPAPRLKLANGTVLKGQALCDATDSESKALGTQRLPDPSALLIQNPTYSALRYPNLLSSPFDVFAGLMQQPRQVPPGFPAVRKGEWRAQYDRRYLLQMYTGDDAPGAVATPVRAAGGGFFPNINNNYVRTALSRHFGKIAVFRGKLPTSPSTREGKTRMGGGQVRYTSFCMNESVYTTKVMDCAYDEEIPLSGDRRYTIVVSRRADRPATATVRCGKAWINWWKAGDGYRDPNFGWFQIRNMLARPSFDEAIQNTKTPGDERSVMGPYLPRLTYFESAGAFQRSRLGRCAR
ncbi:MAG: hypothetical protein U0R52_06835 [Solirubrobacterales bacterium]